MNDESQEIIFNKYEERESYHIVKPLFTALKGKGLNPLYIVIDGHRMVQRAIREVWPDLKIQRCLYHIQREGLRWLRSHPKTVAGRELRKILSTVTLIRTEKEKNLFWNEYLSWKSKHEKYVKSLPSTDIRYRDLKKTMTLLDNAKVDMFRYLKEENLSSTTNKLEGFFSRLKADYRRHRGLSQQHRISYLNWYCFFKSNHN